MNQRLGLSTLVVHNYDAAIEFFVGKLGFNLVEDTTIEAENKRWVVVAPAGKSQPGLLLAEATTPEQGAVVGNQAGGRVAFFLYTDNFQRDFVTYTDKGVRFVRQPVKQDYGTVAVFEDICGNLWDLIEPA